MDSRVQVSARTFASKFRAHIRVGFNWDRFFKENWPIELVDLRSPADLARCYGPWYLDKSGKEVAYDNPEAVPAKLADAAKAIEILNDERKCDIWQYVEEFKTHGDVIEFSAPTYALPQDEYFVLTETIVSRL